jgi:hypothetical protein
LRNEIQYQSKTFTSGFKECDFIKDPENYVYPQTATNRSIPITFMRKSSVKYEKDEGKKLNDVGYFY